MSPRDETRPCDAFAWPVRVYYEDTDAGGVVYHASYLRFLERARTEWLRSLGFDQGTVRESHGVLFAVRAMSLEFMQPARFDDQLRVSVFDLAPRRASFELAQAIHRGDELLCRAHVRVACVDAKDFTPRPVPEVIRKELL